MLQVIRGWIAQVDDAIYRAMEVPSLIPGSEELISRSPCVHHHGDDRRKDR